MVKDLNLVERTGRDLNELKGRFIRSNRQTLPQETANILLGIMDKFAVDEHENYEGSSGDYLTQSYWKEVAKQLPLLEPELSKEALKLLKLMLCGWEGCDHLFELSSTDYFIDCEGDNLVNWRDKGFKSILRVLMKSQEDQPDDLGVLTGRVLLNRRISQIDWVKDDKLTLRLWNGEILQADHVICTVSLGVLKEQHAELFVPRLPEAKVRAIKGLNLGTVDKFLLEFSSPPMPEDIEEFQCLWLEKDLAELRGTEMFWLESVSGFHCVSHQPRLLEGWIIGAHARHMETLTEAKVLEGIQWLFGKFLNFEIPQPKRFVRTQWHSNPNFRGSYSYRTTYADELDVGPWDLATPLLDINGRPKLQFAGEASSKTHNSTVHGAIETGWREADRLNEYYNERGAN
ncbi:spermine oxidase-like [Drosophila tropicalis]|uniref:spermine oxidase-like n=1 Tax=Drosophila tropicalis TaxID=46794 RepID=UPI0035AB7D92